MIFNSTGAETGIFRENQYNATGTDNPAPCVARTSAAIVLTVWDKLSEIYYEKDIGYALSVLRNYFFLRNIK